MCGRFVITLPNDAMAQLFGAAPDNDLPQPPDYNVCPTARIAAVRLGESGARRLSALRWGFLPSWYDSLTAGPLLINARAETIADKPAFREAARAPLPDPMHGVLRMDPRRRQPPAMVHPAAGWHTVGHGRDMAKLGARGRAD